MTEHICTQEGTIARLEERTLNFNRRFDNLEEKIDGLAETLKETATALASTEKETGIALEANKWKHIINTLLVSGAGGGTAFGIMKLLGTFTGK